MATLFLFKEGIKDPVECKFNEMENVIDLVKKKFQSSENEADFKGYNMDLECEIKPNIPLNELGKIENHRIVVFKCKKINVTVNYSGDNYSDSFNAHNKVEKVLRKSLKAFGIEHDEMSSFELYKSENSNEPMVRDYPLACYIDGSQCTLELYLSKPIDFKG